ncbi:MAG: hypothetical protein PVF93_00240 [Chromatiaceae bacterium]|jgi:hypothetical protein
MAAARLGELRDELVFLGGCATGLLISDAGAVILDVMPTDTRILGFGNRWYSPALRAAVSVERPSGAGVRSVSAPYFLTTKLEVFDGRGNGDYLTSHDIEDLVAVIDGRPELLRELAESADDLKDYLATDLPVCW